MNKRIIKKACKEGTLLKIIGTDIVLVGLGVDKTNNQLRSYNAMNVKLQIPLSHASGKVRVANKKEQEAYWETIRIITGVFDKVTYSSKEGFDCKMSQNTISKEK